MQVEDVAHPCVDGDEESRQEAQVLACADPVGIAVGQREREHPGPIGSFTDRDPHTHTVGPFGRDGPLREKGASRHRGGDDFSLRQFGVRRIVAQRLEVELPEVDQIDDDIGCPHIHGHALDGRRHGVGQFEQG